MRKIRGTQLNNPDGIHVDVDTVYVRSDAVFIEEENFAGWEYKEKQYPKNEYIKLISEESQQNKERLALTEDTILGLLMGGF